MAFPMTRTKFTHQLVINALLLLLLSHFSRVRLCATPRTAAHQAPPSMGFFRQEYWSGVSLPSLKPTGAPCNCEHESEHS